MERIRGTGALLLPLPAYSPEASTSSASLTFGHHLVLSRAHRATDFCFYFGRWNPIEQAFQVSIKFHLCVMHVPHAYIQGFDTETVFVQWLNFYMQRQRHTISYAAPNGAELFARDGVRDLSAHTARRFFAECLYALVDTYGDKGDFSEDALLILLPLEAGML